MHCSDCDCTASLKQPASHTVQLLRAMSNLVPISQRGVGDRVGCGVGDGDGRPVWDGVGVSVGAMVGTCDDPCTCDKGGA